ncbi:hypothetical protein DFJ58DRAFT_670847 [Suillus subalutaceus]|uniref:uncharacterized protein n=1 Tax=Suillus subalutaceus TaxID=48586 RepID=UPI001B85EF61|nr:uncharacterized protein DFJ58DRAFT_670847 [Suillus subalutaceus]KAG1833605.1 hypothetical protein DFJ58DRAFT_670847 [Suillus subalutaceus]
MLLSRIVQLLPHTPVLCHLPRSQPHRTVKCSASRTWDNAFNIFSEHIKKALWTKDRCQLCTAWQHEEGCNSSQHSNKHLCSGCGAPKHRAQCCTRSQKS